jgi:hypothetical protein
MLLRPLRRAPMMLGGVGFQAGLDQARRRQMEADRQAAARARAPRRGSVEQLEDLEALHDGGFLSADEYRMLKRDLLGD